MLLKLAIDVAFEHFSEVVVEVGYTTDRNLRISVCGFSFLT